MWTPEDSASPRTSFLVWAMPAIGLVLLGLVLTATPWGLGMTPDSLHYMSAAKSLHDGEGFAQFSPTWPPLYPIAIASAMSLGAEVLVAARWLNALLAGANVLLLLSIAARLRWRDEFSTVFGLLIALQAGFLHSHFLLWSEALFLGLALLDLLLLERALRAPSSALTWAGLALVAAAAALTRYAGIFLIVLNAVLVISCTPWPGRRRAIGAFALTVAATWPLVAWMLFNRARGLSSVNLSVNWHPPSATHISELGQTVASWFDLPVAWGLPAFGVVLLLAAGVCGSALLRSARVDPLSTSLGAFVILYTAFLGLSISVANHYTPLDERILFPMLPIVWLLLLYCAGRLRPAPIRLLALALLALVLARGALYGFEDWRHTRAHGLGLTAKHIREMPVLDWLRTIPPEIPLVSNGPDLISIHLQRPSQMLASTYNPTSLAKNADFESALEDLTRGPTLIVHFQATAYRTYLPGPEVLEAMSDMQLVYRGPDAVAWIRHAAQTRPGATH